MWPKALSQLIELAPHLSRLVPMADRFLQSRTSGTGADESSGRDLSEMTESLRGDLGRVAAAHAELSAQLEAQSERMAAVAADARAAKLAVESMAERNAALAAQLSMQGKLLIALLVLDIAIVALLVYFLTR